MRGNAEAGSTRREKTESGAGLYRLPILFYNYSSASGMGIGARTTSS